MSPSAVEQILARFTAFEERIENRLQALEARYKDSRPIVPSRGDPLPKSPLQDKNQQIETIQPKAQDPPPEDEHQESLSTQPTSVVNTTLPRVSTLSPEKMATAGIIFDQISQKEPPPRQEEPARITPRPTLPNQPIPPPVAPWQTQPQTPWNPTGLKPPEPPDLQLYLSPKPAPKSQVSPSQPAIQALPSQEKQQHHRALLRSLEVGYVLTGCPVTAQPQWSSSPPASQRPTPPKPPPKPPPLSLLYKLLGLKQYWACNTRMGFIQHMSQITLFRFCPPNKPQSVFWAQFLKLRIFS